MKLLDFKMAHGIEFVSYMKSCAASWQRRRQKKMNDEIEKETVWGM
jgi:hypothetical protein